MTDYAFSHVIVWDSLGGAVRVARNARVDVLHPDTGLTAPGLKQNGQPVTYISSAQNGQAVFTATIPEVDLSVAGMGLLRVASLDVSSAAAVAAADEAAASALAAQAAAEAAVGGGSGGGYLIDTDGVPYIPTEV